MRHLVLMEVSQGVAYRLFNSSDEGAFKCIECAQAEVRSVMDELIVTLNATSYEMID